MPTFEYRCKKCLEDTEQFYNTYNVKHPTKCKSCGGKLERLCSLPVLSIKGQSRVNTVGQLAEQNSRKLGKEQIQLLEEERLARPEFSGKLPEGATPVKRETAELPFWRNGEDGAKKSDKPLDLAKVKDVQKYIKTGEGLKP